MKDYKTCSLKAIENYVRDPVVIFENTDGTLKILGNVGYPESFYIIYHNSFSLRRAMDFMAGFKACYTLELKNKELNK